MSGLVPLEVTSDGAEQVVFEFSANDGESWVFIAVDGNPGDGFTAVWDTGASNGSFLVQATASAGDLIASESVGVIVDNRAPNVSVRATTSPFSPNGDGIKDTTRLRVRSDEPALLKLELVAGRRRVLKSWSTKDYARSLSIPWKGRAGGSRLKDGRYRFRGKARDPAGNSAAHGIHVVVDTRAPRVRWQSIRPEPATGNKPVKFVFRSRDRAARLKVALEISDEAGRVQTPKPVVRRSGLRSIKWGPRYRDGGLLYPGNYVARLVVTDDAGNRRRSRVKRWRIHRAVTPKVFERMEGAGRRVALTFDDCVYGTEWSRILTTLRAFDAGATFFCPGVTVRANPALARRTVAHGHAVGSHGYDHAYLSGQPVAYTQTRLLRDREIWWDVARVTAAPYFRPPYGAYDGNTIRGAGLASYGRLIMWDVDPSDWMNPSPSTIAHRVIQGTRPGSIVLLHVKRNTAAALPAILRGMQQRSLKAVTLPKLFGAAGLR